ncbi:hypothetical protein B0H15DRAFT_804724 [Mycena belliarum]|uniref:Uncharacterized protein n=1 Tax=Mycena belliarum TaxID=1033014 RepID=A0AAD6TUG2_9AGAR|nr:hypothetical protein B0H15DRAFT_804724 [Mycena belliae]
MGRQRTGKPPGRVSHFQDEKLAWLEAAENDFRSEDRSTFYDNITKKFLARYGFDLPVTENVPGDIEDWVPRNRKEGLDGEALEAEKLFQDDARKKLRTKLSNWYRTRFTGKKVHSGALNKILKTMRGMSSASTRPRRQTAVALYSGRFYETKMKAEFDALWKTAKDTLTLDKRISMCQDFVRAKWAAETEEFRESMEEEIRQNHKDALRKFKEAREVTESTAKEYHEALESFDEVGIPVADAMSEYLGMHVMIFAVGPTGSQKGEVRLRSVFSDTAEGQISKMWGEFDRNAFTAAEASMTRYGRAFFTREECRARQWPPVAAAPDLEGLLPMENRDGTISEFLVPAAITTTRTTTRTAPAATTTPIAPAASTASTASTAPSMPANASTAGKAAAAPESTDTLLDHPTLPADDVDRWGWCDTLVNLHKLMGSKDWGPRWVELGERIVAFELSLFYVDGGRLKITQSRPAEYAKWMKEHRTGDDFPVAADFDGRLLQWWYDIGPVNRVDLAEGEEWTRKERQERDWVAWSRLRVGGNNGVILVLLGLTWWGQSIVNAAAGEGLGAGEAALSASNAWQYMVEDVLWALGEMTDPMNDEDKRDWEAARAEVMGLSLEDDMSTKPKETETSAKGKSGKGKGVKEKKAPPKKAAKRTRDEDEAEDGPPTKQRRSTRSPPSNSEPASKPQVVIERPRPKPKPKLPRKSVAAADGPAVSVEGSTPQRDVDMGAEGGTGTAGTERGPTVLLDEERQDVPQRSPLLAPVAIVRRGDQQSDPDLNGGDPFANNAVGTSDPFAGMSAEEREDFENELLLDGEAGDEEDGGDDEGMGQGKMVDVVDE